MNVIDDGRKAAKVRADLISPIAMLELSEMLEWGCRPKESGGKGYGEGDWQWTMKPSDFIGGILRHTFKIMAGQKKDVESGKSHAVHILFNAMGLVHVLARGDKYEAYSSPENFTTKALEN
jgi:hypothetical protein